MAEEEFTAALLNTNCHYATADELAWMRAHGEQLRAGAQIVMIGAGPGVLLFALLEAHPAGARAFVVDNDTVQWTQAHLKAAGLGDAVTYLVGDSSQAGRDWQGGPIDLLIVDGDHAYAGAKADIDAWLGHVARSGTVFFHDYDAAGTEFEAGSVGYGVKQAVDELIEGDQDRWIIGERVGTSAVVDGRVVRKLADAMPFEGALVAPEPEDHSDRDAALDAEREATESLMTQEPAAEPEPEPESAKPVAKRPRMGRKKANAGD